jgi:5-methylcytosine-specific restriction endonuclease McrA
MVAADPAKPTLSRAAAYAKAKYLADPDKARAKARGDMARWRQRHPNLARERSRLHGKNWRDAKRADFQRRRIAWRERHPDLVKLIESELVLHRRHRARQKMATRRQRSDVQAKSRAWAAANRENRLAYVARWKASNRGRCNAHDRKRNAAKAGNPTANDQAVAAFYEHVRTALILRCYYCDRETFPWERHVDHVIPVSRHGPHALHNLVCACSACNLKKHAKLPDALGLLPF